MSNLSAQIPCRTFTGTKAPSGLSSCSAWSRRLACPCFWAFLSLLHCPLSPCIFLSFSPLPLIILFYPFLTPSYPWSSLLTLSSVSSPCNALSLSFFFFISLVILSWSFLPLAHPFLSLLILYHPSFLYHPCLSFITLSYPLSSLLILSGPWSPFLILYHLFLSFLILDHLCLPFLTPASSFLLFFLFLVEPFLVLLVFFILVSYFLFFYYISYHPCLPSFILSYHLFSFFILSVSFIILSYPLSSFHLFSSCLILSLSFIILSYPFLCLFHPFFSFSILLFYSPFLAPLIPYH